MHHVRGCTGEFSMKKNQNYFFQVQCCRYGVSDEYSSRELKKNHFVKTKMCCSVFFLLAKMCFWLVFFLVYLSVCLFLSS
jgi:hypothetical protein